MLKGQDEDEKFIRQFECQQRSRRFECGVRGIVRGGGLKVFIKFNNKQVIGGLGKSSFSGVMGEWVVE